MNYPLWTRRILFASIVPWGVAIICWGIVLGEHIHHLIQERRAESTVQNLNYRLLRGRVGKSLRGSGNNLRRGLPVVANAERHLVGVASHIGDSNVSPKLPIGSIRSDSNKVFALPNLRRSSVSCDSEQVAGVAQSAYGDTQGSEGNPQRTEHTEGGNDIFPFCKEWLICGGILLICLGAFIGHLDRRYDRRTEDYANWILNYEGVNGEYANPNAAIKIAAILRLFICSYFHCCFVPFHRCAA
jgi:hypothetical protein